jgi:outer membrane protein assembly factor BamD (BamD/ComL family)
MRWLSRKTLPLAILTAITAFPLAVRATGAAGLDDPFEGSAKAGDDDTPSIERRTPSWFHRPAKDSPAEQLALADRLRAEGSRRRARSAYRALSHKWNDSDEAVRGQMAYAELFEEQGKWLRAFDEYQYLVAFYVGRFPFDTVLDRQEALAEKVVSMLHGRFLVLPGWEDPVYAVPLFETLLANAPRSARAPAWQYRIGEIQEGDEELEKAILAYERASSRYPESPVAEKAAVRRAMCLYQVALRRDARSERALQEAIGAFEALIESYPRSRTAEDTRPRMEEMVDRLAELYYGRAFYYDYTVKRPTSACLAYLEFLKLFPTSAHVAEASARVEILRKEKPTDEADKSKASN